MKTTVALIAGLLVALLFPQPSLRAQDAPAWNPEKTWVFVVGLLEWKNPDIYASFPAAVKNRRDRQLAQHFKTAGVPEDQVVYLEDAAATKAAAVREFSELLERTDEGDMLVFYFAGHGSRKADTNETWLVTYDAGQSWDSAWHVRDVFQSIEQKFNGEKVLLLADCCHSGALYDEARNHRQSKISYAALTSSYSHNISTGAWTFSNSVLAGLRGNGAVDLDGDREITLAEIAKYTELELAFIEEQKSMFYASQGLPAKTPFATAQRSLKAGVGERLEVEYEGKWYKAKTIDVREDEVKVRYIGYDSSWDEWVGPDRRRKYQPEEFAEGAKVEVLWTGDKKWYPARVLRSWYGLHFVRYENYDSTWDEWIGPGSIRPR